MILSCSHPYLAVRHREGLTRSFVVKCAESTLLCSLPYAYEGEGLAHSTGGYSESALLNSQGCAQPKQHEQSSSICPSGVGESVARKANDFFMTTPMKKAYVPSVWQSLNVACRNTGVRLPYLAFIGAGVKELALNNQWSAL